jgi:membrane protein implicated in regulation of membrane protease activity
MIEPAVKTVAVLAGTVFAFWLAWRGINELERRERERKRKERDGGNNR